MSDNGCQPTLTAFLQASATLEIQQVFTTANNLQGEVCRDALRKAGTA